MTTRNTNVVLPAKAIGDLDGFRILLGILRDVFTTILQFFMVLDRFNPNP